MLSVREVLYESIERYRQSDLGGSLIGGREEIR
jgi:hypothetical protein